MRDNRATRELCSLDPCRSLVPSNCEPPRWCPRIRCGCSLGVAAALAFAAGIGTLWSLRDSYYELRRDPYHVLQTVKLKALKVDCAELEPLYHRVASLCQGEVVGAARAHHSTAMPRARAAGNKLGDEAGVAFAKALETNASLHTLDVYGAPRRLPRSGRARRGAGAAAMLTRRHARAAQTTGSTSWKSSFTSSPEGTMYASTSRSSRIDSGLVEFILRNCEFFELH